LNAILLNHIALIGAAEPEDMLGEEVVPTALGPDFTLAVSFASVALLVALLTALLAALLTALLDALLAAALLAALLLF